MTHADKIEVFVAFMNVMAWGALFLTARTAGRRLDEQSLRMTEIEHHVGISPLFPLDIECPICEAAIREPCNGRGTSSHGARYNVSPGAQRALDRSEFGVAEPALGAGGLQIPCRYRRPSPD